MALSRDAVGPGSTGIGFSAVTSITWTHTAGGTADYGRVSLGITHITSQAASSATWGGAAMTNVGRATSTIFQVTLFGYAQILEKIAPATGAQAIVATFPANAYGDSGSLSYIGAHQTVATGNTNSAIGTATFGGSGQPSVVVSSSTGNMVQDALAVSLANTGGAVAAAADQTLAFYGRGSGTQGGGSEDTAGAASTTLSWVLTLFSGTGTTVPWAQFAAEIIAAGAGGGIAIPVLTRQYRERWAA